MYGSVDVTDPPRHHRSLPVTSLESLRPIVLIRIIPVRPMIINIMLIIHAFRTTFCLVFGLLAVEPVLAFGLG